VQQSQGRVAPTTRVGAAAAVAPGADEALEAEADLLGARAKQR